MDIHALTNKVYTPWGKKYSKMCWRDSWCIYINLATKERKTIAFNKYKPVNHIIYWFDTNVLQRINRDSRNTLDVRIRIVCGLINKLSHKDISMDMKREFMECVWDAYNKFYKDYLEWHCKYELNLPF